MLEHHNIQNHTLHQEILIELLQEGNKKAIPMIYDKYSGALYGIILRIVKDESAASEILQDTFVKVWQKKDQYNPSRGRLYTWMMNIARNLSINHLNSKRVKQQEKIHPLENNVYHINSPYRIREETMDVESLLSRIDDKYREVIELAYFQGYTQKEISERLKMPLGTVKSCIKIALRELKKLYLGKSLLSSGIVMMVILLSYI